ncbi:MAG: VWA domain containing CoxE-like protein [Planctomycetes bacterium ADurb.Bin126]|nr:MAG: VWA domain containing CoxE-like protein [Planctomycetes bacterium ADurb.Bin126]
MAEEGVYRYLPTRMADRLRGMGVAVRKQMDGSMQGLHRSPAFGSSVEFAEYRGYVPGDPIRRIDWAVYARTDRYVIRQFQEEVNIRAYVLLDISRSMSYRQSGPMTKLEYASFLAAGMMYLMVQQGDSTSLVTFDADIRDMHDLTGSFTGLKPMLRALEGVTAEREGDIEAALHAAAERIPGKAMVVLISDLLQDPRQALRGVQHLVHDGKDVTVFHVLDPGELRLPIDGLYEVEALETREKMVVDIGEIREAYLRQLREYLDEVRTGCSNVGADYILVNTNTEVHDTLHKRSATR